MPATTLDYIQIGPDFLLDNRTGHHAPGYIAQFPRKLAVKDPNHAMALIESLMEDAGAEALQEAAAEAEVLDIDAVQKELTTARQAIQTLSRNPTPTEVITALVKIDLCLIRAGALLGGDPNE